MFGRTGRDPRSVDSAVPAPRASIAIELPHHGRTTSSSRLQRAASARRTSTTGPTPTARCGGSELPGAHGHEVSGVVSEVGDAAGGLAPGDRVCLEPALACACGSCEPCLAGRPRSCRNRSTLPVWGFADAIVVPARGLVPVPAGLDLEVACLAEPLASAVHGIRHGWSAPPAGASTACASQSSARERSVSAPSLAARALGAAEVTVVARHEHQARVAVALGADRVLEDDAEIRPVAPPATAAARRRGRGRERLGARDRLGRSRRTAARSSFSGCPTPALISMWRGSSSGMCMVLRSRLRDARRHLRLLDRARPPRGDRRRLSADHAPVPARRHRRRLPRGGEPRRRICPGRRRAKASTKRLTGDGGRLR